MSRKKGKMNIRSGCSNFGRPFRKYANRVFVVNGGMRQRDGTGEKARNSFATCATVAPYRRQKEKKGKKERIHRVNSQCFHENWRLCRSNGTTRNFVLRTLFDMGVATQR